MPIRAAMIAALLLTACGGGSAASSAGTNTPAPRPARGSANLIVEAEITGGGARNALEVIQLLRPSMLRARNGATAEQAGMEIVMYLDGVRAGGRDALTAVPADRVKEIRFLNASDATTRFGTGHPLGAVLVTTKR